MKRIAATPRPGWEKTIEAQGFVFHTVDGTPYWDESVYYEFTSAQIDQLEKATYALNEMCLAAVQEVIDRDLFEQFLIPEPFVEFVKTSWENDEATLVGRFDFSYDGVGEPRMLEYNADTPTSLLEAAVIQWQWLRDVHPSADQFNSLHERLIEAWKSIASRGKTWFTSISGNIEDHMTVNYLRDTAIQAGLETQYIEVERLGWNHDRELFVDESEQHIAQCFKLYPWEWMIREQFAGKLLKNNTRWLEAPWKMILSNKAILPLLWEMFPDSPYLLPAGFEPITTHYVRKPILSREGANIQVVVDGQIEHETDGIYPGPYIYQELCPLPERDGFYPLVGSWMCNGYACGIGIREDATPVTGNLSRFVPHLFH